MAALICENYLQLELGGILIVRIKITEIQKPRLYDCLPFRTLYLYIILLNFLEKLIIHNFPENSMIYKQKCKI